MATLTGQKIKNTYDGLLKTTDSTQGLPATGKTIIEDGLGNDSSLSLGQANNGAEVTGTLTTDNISAEGRVSSQGLTTTDTIVIDNTEIQFNQPSDLSGNTFVGTGAGNVGTSVGPFNVALGNGALSSATTSSRCVAIGHDALVNDTTGNKNIAIGDLSLQGNTTGSKNIAIGTDTIKTRTGAAKNIAIGDQSMRDGASGNNNIAIGSDALLKNSASFIVGLGYNSLRNNTNAVGNTGIGANALANSTGASAKHNTALGQGAGAIITTGANNTLLGYYAQPSSGTANNEITLGNGSVSVLRCAVTSITSLSDERDKTDIEDLEYGLDFIDSLQPRQFTWDNRPEIVSELDEEGNQIEVEEISENKGKKDFGFIAQEVQELDNETLRLVYDENPDKLEVSYGKLVPILVKAIQELRAEVKALKK